MIMWCFPASAVGPFTLNNSPCSNPELHPTGNPNQLQKPKPWPALYTVKGAFWTCFYLGVKIHMKRNIKDHVACQTICEEEPRTSDLVLLQECNSAPYWQKYYSLVTRVDKFMVWMPEINSHRVKSSVWLLDQFSSHQLHFKRSNFPFFCFVLWKNKPLLLFVSL